MIRTVLIFIILTMLSGCGTIYRFDEDNDEVLINRGVYPATQFDFKALSADTSGMFGDLALMMMPFMLLDIPISLVTDTVMLPYDIGMYVHNSHYINYWDDVSTYRKIEMPMSEYLQYYNETGSVAMLSVSRKYHDEDLLKFYFDIASANDKWLKTSSKIITMLTARADKHDEYTALRSHTCKAIASDLTNKKFGGGINQIVEGERYSVACIENLADNGLVCRSLVMNKKTPVKYLRKCYQEYPERLNKWLSKVPSLPVDIQTSMYDYEYSKLTALNYPLSKVESYNNSMAVIENIARVTKDSALIKRMFGLNNKYIIWALISNPATPLEYKLSNENFLSNYAKEEKNTSKEELIEIISKYSDKQEFLLGVARGKRVDIDVYDAIMQYTPAMARTEVYNAIVYNRNVEYKDVLFKLVCNYSPLAK